MRRGFLKFKPRGGYRLPRPKRTVRPTGRRRPSFRRPYK